jgi:hypothetical protein
MGHESTGRRRRAARAALGICASAIFLSVIASSALAAPTHPRKEALDITGLNHACGAAVDSKGDFYASSAGTSEVKVYDAAHTFLTSIADTNEPCGLAVTTTGVLYVSEKATGEVVRFKPNAYPFVGTPTYGPREVIDASGKAKGIAVDRFDDGLYVAEGDRVAVYVNELQAVSLIKATAGTFKLTFEGQETAPLPFNATAAEVQAALAGLSTIGAGNVEVSKSAETFSVFFVGKFAYTDVATMSGDGSALTATNPKISIIEASKGLSGQIGEGTLTEASGVAAYTYSNGAVTERYLWVADAKGLEADRLYLFRGGKSGENEKALKLRRELDGTNTPDGSFGFGAAGAYLAADPGNRNSAGKCVAVGGQACTAGHLFLYDAENHALDEFDASGEYLDRTANAAFADAEPTAVAIDRSGGANDGTLYVTAGPGSAAKALAFGPLKAPGRETLGEPLSHILANAQSVATDSHGDVYAVAESAIHIYGPDGAEITEFEDEFKPKDIAVDSAGNVYLLDLAAEFDEKEVALAGVVYYTASEYPPSAGTSYSRHEPAIVNSAAFPKGKGLLRSIAVNPGPGPGKDQLFVSSNSVIRRYGSVAKGSTLIDAEFGTCVPTGFVYQAIAVNGANGTVYISANPNQIFAVNEAGTECLAQFDNKGSPSGKGTANPFPAVDQANGHVIEYDGKTGSVHEYDAAGSFIAEFGAFTEEAGGAYRVAVDSACAIHEPPLDETTTPTCKEYDPADGTVYVAFDDPNLNNHPPYDVNAFGPLRYGPGNEKFSLAVVKAGSGSGKVTSSPAGIDCGLTCSAEFEEGKVVELKAEAASGSEFVKWSGPCSGSGECKVATSEAKSVTAEFKALAKSNFKLTVAKTGAGSGTVTSSPAGINCGVTCSAEFEAGVEVTLSASAESGSVFSGWSGSGCSGTGPCKVTMSEAREVTATFALEAHLLSVTKEGTGTGTGTVTSSPTGINCGSECSASFDHGTAVTLSGTSGAKTKAVQWTGCGSVNGENKCLVTMSAAKAITATFELEPAPKFKLTVAMTGAGSGTVTSSPAGINCGATCSAEFEEGTLVTLSQSAEAGSEFREWSGACSGKGACEVTMSEAKSVNARFANAKQLLTVTKSAGGTGGIGTVSSKPKGIKCAGACEVAKAALYKGTVVELSAKPAGESTFSEWTGCDSVNGEGKCVVSMSAAKEVTAVFGGTSKAIAEPHALTVKKAAGTGFGTVKAAGLACEADCTETKVLYQGEITSPKVKPAKIVVLSAVPAFGSSFSGWTGCKAEPEPEPGNVQCEVEMKTAHLVTAQFTAKPTKTLTIEKSPYAGGTGTVSSKPKGLKCGPTCTTQSAALPEGAEVLLTEKPASGMKFAGWEGGGCSGTAPTCTVTLSSSKSVKAEFESETTPPKAILNPQELTVSKAGTGYGALKAAYGLACEAACTTATFLYTGGVLLPNPKPAAVVTLIATAQAGSELTSWTGCEGNPTPGECVVTMNTAKEVIARFEE